MISLHGHYHNSIQLLRFSWMLICLSQQDTALIREEFSYIWRTEGSAFQIPVTELQETAALKTLALGSPSLLNETRKSPPLNAHSYSNSDLSAPSSRTQRVMAVQFRHLENYSQEETCQDLCGFCFLLRLQYTFVNNIACESSLCTMQFTSQLLIYRNKMLISLSINGSVLFSCL